MPTPTLLEMATNKAIRVINQINDFADMPYDMARPMLLHVTDPQQLRDIELNCPQIHEQSEELWRRYIKRDIPDWEQKLKKPKNPKNWHQTYKRLVRLEEKKSRADEEALLTAMQSEGMKKAQTSTLVVKKALPHPRGEGESDKFVDGVPRKDYLDRQKIPSLKNAKNGRDQLAAIRRQAAIASRQKASSTPLTAASQSQQLASAKRQIRQAPESMVRELSRGPNQLVIAPRELLPHEQVQLAEFKRERAYNRNIIGPRAPGRKSDLQHYQQHRREVEAIRTIELAEKEDKLRAITQQQKKEAATPKKQAKPSDFAPSPVVTDYARSRSNSPQKKSAKDSPLAAASPSRPPRQPALGCTAAAGPPPFQSTAEERRAIAGKPSKAPRASSLGKRKQPEPDTTAVVPEASSPSPSTQPIVRQRPAVNIFMPAKKRKV